MRTILMTAALIPAASAHMLSTVCTPVVVRTTPTIMNVASWYDQGLRLSSETVEPGQPVDQAVESSTLVPAGMSASIATVRPLVVEKALAYEADIAQMQARIDAFPKQEGTMYFLLRDQIKMAESRLAATIESAQVGGGLDRYAAPTVAVPDAAPETTMRREAYYCNDEGCWIASQYFCDDTGCWIMDGQPLMDDAEPMTKIDKKGPPEKTIVQEGIFAPAVKLTAEIMGRKELNTFRASVIAEHTKVISAFVDTSESKFGQIALKSMFEAAYVSGIDHLRPPLALPSSVAAPSSRTDAHSTPRGLAGTMTETARSTSRKSRPPSTRWASRSSRTSKSTSSSRRRTRTRMVRPAVWTRGNSAASDLARACAISRALQM